MNVKTIDYQGIASCELTAGNLRAVVTTEVGPRVIFFGFKNGENMLYECKADFKKKKCKEFVGYGGHRLWSSPEDPVRTYEADGNPVEVEETEEGVRFTSPADTVSGLKKSIVLNLTEEGMDVCHIVENVGQWPISFSAWGLTQMKNGGTAVLFQNTEDTGLLANRNLSLWPYTDLRDERLYLGDKYITVKADSGSKKPLKIGMMANKGCAAYINGGNMFVKYFFAEPQEQYPDNNCNCECYTCKDFTEVESLSPLTLAGKGEIVSGYEFWELYPDVELSDPRDEAAIAAALSVIKTESANE